MFQTAFPFGYLIQFALVVGVAFAALVLIARGVARRDKRLSRAGLALAGMVALVLGLAALRRDIDEWNPRFAPEVVHGRWVEDDRTLELRADGTYTLREGSSVTSGRYALDDWNLDLLGAVAYSPPNPPSALELRVVEDEGEYRIIRDPEDLDTWDGRMGYRRTPPAKVR